jgi:hypothetical protein
MGHTGVLAIRPSAFKAARPGIKQPIKRFALPIIQVGLRMTLPEACLLHHSQE